MQTVWLALVGLVPPLALLELRAEHRQVRRSIYLLRPLTTGSILLLALLSPEPFSTTYLALIAVGLLCSLAGDVSLMLPGKLFLQGLLSFLLAQLCYIVAFVSVGGPPRSLLVLLLLAAYGAWLVRRLWPRLGRYRVPVAVYAAVILVMVASAWQQAASSGGLRSWLALAGSVLFVASDSVLALDRFEAGDKRRQVVVLGTYFTAQWLIALSVTRL